MTPHEYLKDGVKYEMIRGRITTNDKLDIGLGLKPIILCEVAGYLPVDMADDLGQFIADAINEKIKREGK